MKNTVQKYLDEYAHPLSRVSFNKLQLTNEIWDEVVVIPARKELQFARHPLLSLQSAALLSQKKILLILVINGNIREDYENSLLTRELMQRAPRSFELSDSQSHLIFCGLHFLDIAILDSYSPRFCLGPKEGVGLARKIGADLALQLIAAHRVTSSWIRNSDADVTFPDSYFFNFTNIEAKKTSAIIYPFDHSRNSDPMQDQAMRLYESWLRYYREGLDWAGSPFAYFSIASTMIVNATSYAQVRGFPKDRMAGEDFYLLNKLAKVGSVVSNPDREPLLLSSRFSDRVPFGTGQRVLEYHSKLAQDEPVLFYEPKIFLTLKQLISALTEFAASENTKTEALQAMLDQKLSPAVSRIFYETFEVSSFIRNLMNYPTGQSRIQAVHSWLDGFRTLKLVHALRDRLYPSIPAKDALEGFSRLAKKPVNSVTL